MRHTSPVLITSLFLLVQAGCVAAGGGADWPMFRRDFAGTGYSPLTQIDTANVSDLGLAWIYSLEGVIPAEPGGAPRPPNSQATPIVVDSVMYLPAGDRVVAIDPTTGGEIWRYTLTEGAPSRRGVAYWPGRFGQAPRILFTAGTRLIALNAETGLPVESFGADGVVDLVVPYLSVPFIYDDIVVVGANTPPGTVGGVGNARAYDVVAGGKLWEFASVPGPGAIGNDTWEGDSWEGRLGANAWPFYFTMDPERELIYLPLASPIPGAYGGDRLGANLFGNAVVAVNVRTGAYVWHFQTIHHDIWDADPPAPPVLFDIRRGGRTIPALGLTTKSGYLYVLDRTSGEPVYGVEERAVPASEVPGEQTFPTQPIPVLPPPLGQVSYEPADLVTPDDTSLEHAEACRALTTSVGEIHNAGPFTPWVYRPEGSPPGATLLFPGLVGGPNWGGAAFDPNTGYIFAFSQNLGSFGWVEEAEAGAPLPYDRAGPRPNSFDVEIGDARWPCQAPPWGELFAIDSATGEFAWRRPLGITEGLPPERQETGRPGRAAAIVTRGGLVFIASTDDNRFRALDATSGRELWSTLLEQRGNANPLTYLGHDGQQYVVVVATDRVMGFRMPE